MFWKYTAFAAALTLANCAPTQANAPATEPETMPEETSYCPIRDPKNIEAWIDAMPGDNDNPTLIVKFTATAPTPNYTFTFGYLAKKATQSPTAKMRLLAHAPTDPVIQVETETDIRVEMPEFYRGEIEGLRIYCGGEVLISLDAVTTAY